MSGPMAAGFGIEAAVLVSAQAIAQGVAEIAAGMTAAEQQAEALRLQRRAERQQMRAARQAGSEKQLREEADKSARAARTQQLEAMLATLPATQDGDLAITLESLLAAGVSAKAQLAAYVAQARLAAGVSASAGVIVERQQLVEHILERLALDADEPLPATLAALALQLVQAPTAERAEALATELRYQVQQHNEQRRAAAEQRKLQAAAAVVLEQSLKDLGYAIEEIEETLFVEGGVAHFQRPEWGDYFVRLRIDPQRSAMNFNVVRAGTAGEDRRHEDMLAEERWCSEFPRLFETLKARGIPINVTRLLQAGEAPVQVVDASSLPALANMAERHRGHDRQMQLDGKSGG